MARFLLALLLCFAAPCRAQHDTARYTVFGEILGNTGLASLNFDVANGEGYGFRIGGLLDPRHALPCSDRNTECQRDRQRDDSQMAFAMLVVMGQRLVGERQHKLEIGLGVLVAHTEPGVLDALPRGALTATVGYRLQPNAGRVGFRVGLAPIVAPDRVLLRPGFSLSYGLPTPR